MWRSEHRQTQHQEEGFFHFLHTDQVDRRTETSSESVLLFSPSNLNLLFSAFGEIQLRFIFSVSLFTQASSGASSSFRAWTAPLFGPDEFPVRLDWPRATVWCSNSRWMEFNYIYTKVHALLRVRMSRRWSLLPGVENHSALAGRCPPLHHDPVPSSNVC